MANVARVDNTDNEDTEEHYATNESSSEESDESDEGDYVCAFCSQILNSRHAMNLHLCLMGDDAPARGSNRSTRTDRYVRRHRPPAHRRQIARRCNVCREKFTDADAMGEHLMNHMMGVNEGPYDVRPFKCIVCPAKFSQRQVLAWHLLENHKQKKIDSKIKPVKMWFNLVSRRQTRTGGGSRGFNGIHVVFDGIVMGIATDLKLIGPIHTRLTNKIDTRDFTEAEFWFAIDTKIIEVYNRMPGITMHRSQVHRRFPPPDPTPNYNSFFTEVGRISFGYV